MPAFTSLFEKLLGKLTSWYEGLVVMLPNIVLALLIVVIALFAARAVERVVRRLLARVTDNQPVSHLLATLARISVVLIALFFALGLLKLDKTVTSLLAGVGVVGLALGFAFQDIAANFMSGFIMAIRGPFKVGDLVEAGGHHGRIKHLSLRASEIETLDGLSILIPNKQIFQNPITNYTSTPTRRLEINMGTAYGDDMQTVRSVVRRAVSEVPFRQDDREVEVFFKEFGDSSINFTVRIWLNRADEPSYLHAQSEAMIAIKSALDREGLTIPFPIRTLDFGADAVGGERLDGMHLRVARLDAASHR